MSSMLWSNKEEIDQRLKIIREQIRQEEQKKKEELEKLRREEQEEIKRINEFLKQKELQPKFDAATIDLKNGMKFLEVSLKHKLGYDTIKKLAGKIGVVFKRARKICKITKDEICEMHRQRISHLDISIKAGVGVRCIDHIISESGLPSKRIYIKKNNADIIAAYQNDKLSVDDLAKKFNTTTQHVERLLYNAKLFSITIDGYIPREERNIRRINRRVDRMAMAHEMWLNGKKISDIAKEYKTSVSNMGNRICLCRKYRPDLFSRRNKLKMF